MIEIEKGYVPDNLTTEGKRVREKYPFRYMQPGDSFLAPGSQALRNYVSTKQRELGRRFHIEPRGDDFRVYRLNDDGTFPGIGGGDDAE